KTAVPPPRPASAHPLQNPGPEPFPTSPPAWWREAPACRGVAPPACTGRPFMSSQPSPRGRGIAARVALVAVLLAAAAGVAFAGYKLFPPRPPGGPPPGVEPEVAGKQLYDAHCAACHGDKGDGQGPAARFLYPRPRDFTENRFRLVTTVNGVPSDD